MGKNFPCFLIFYPNPQNLKTRITERNKKLKESRREEVASRLGVSFCRVHGLIMEIDGDHRLKMIKARGELGLGSGSKPALIVVVTSWMGQ